jgi:transcriptional regulator with XRE-family HTH domain
MSNNNEIFKTRFKELKQLTELTYESLSEYVNIGIEADTLKNYTRKNYSSIPDIDKLIKIALFFNVTLEYLVGNTTVKSVYQNKNYAQFNLSAFRKRLKSLINTTGNHSMKQIAKSVHITSKTLHSYVDSKSMLIPDSKNLIALSKKFNVTLDYLIGI